MVEQTDLSFVPAGFEKDAIEKDGKKEVVVALESMPYSNRYGLLESALAEAVEKDVITPLPTSKPGHKSEYSDSRLKTMRKRLYMLGYLEHNSGQANLGPQLEGAIKSFQGEAAIVVTDFAVDGWVGEETWTAMQELVSFETPSNLQRWFDGKGKPCLVLKRAVHLRLYAFGLCSRAPAYGIPDDSEISCGLNRFTELSSKHFHFSDKPLSHGMCLDTVNLLMDQDGLIACLAGTGPLMQAKESTPELESPELLDYACRFVINITKAELWMLGYEQVAPSGYQAADTRRAIDSGYELRGAAFEALKQFWIDKKDQSHATMRAKQHVTKYSPLFFQKIYADISTEETETQLGSEAVYQQLQDEVHENQGEKLIQKVWHELRSIGSRIWDGLKRAGHWFKGVVKKSVAFLTNITRLAYHFILKSFEAVRAVVAGVVGALTFFGKKELRFPIRGLDIRPNVPVLRMRRDHDFDFTTMVNNEGNPGDVEKIAAYLENKSSMFVVSCKFLASLLNLVIDVIKHSLFTGWAALLMALLKLYKSIKQWAPGIIAFERQEHRMLTDENT